MLGLYVTWPFGEQDTTEQDTTSEGSPHVANVPVQNMIWANTARGPFRVYPGLHDLPCARCPINWMAHDC